MTSEVVGGGELPKTVGEVISRIDEGWSRLGEFVHSLSEEQLTGPRDGAGWSAKDHLLHIAAWERWLLPFFRREPLHVAMGVDEATYQDPVEDRLNGILQQREKDLPLSEARKVLQATHGEVVALLQSLSDEDLQRPYAEYQPGSAGGEGQPAVRSVVGNTYEHYDDHLRWMRELVGS